MGNFEHAKPGERYYIWLLPDGRAEDYDQSNGVEKCACTVIGKKKHGSDWVVGWKAGEKQPIGEFSLTLRPEDYEPGHLESSQFVLKKSVDQRRRAELITESAVAANVSSGAKCKRCYEYNSFATPNQPDGSFLCFVCRKA